MDFCLGIECRSIEKISEGEPLSKPQLAFKSSDVFVYRFIATSKIYYVVFRSKVLSSQFSVNEENITQNIRLVNGTTNSSGRVEIYFNGEWGTVCNKGWDLADATVVCRQLGYPAAIETYRYTATYVGEGSGFVWLINVGCHGNESGLLECKHESFGQTECTHKEDVGVLCKGKHDVLF